MDDYSRKDKDRTRRELSSEDKNLELRLGPPGEDKFDNSSQHVSRNSYDAQSFFNNDHYAINQVWKRHHASISNAHHRVLHLQQSLEGLVQVMKPKPSQPCDSRGPPVGMHCAENKAFSTAVHNGQKRIAPGPVVGWPPVRSFRKNLASAGSPKSPPPESENATQSKEFNFQNQKPIENRTRNMLVKINMDGIPIGRKVNLKACDSYDKLSQAVDKLFRGLLAAQNGACYEIKGKDEGGKAITGLLDGSGEYTLVYEDIEGDRMLVGDDVPWNMFVSTVKRLRVLKSSDIPTLSGASIKGKALS